MGTQGKQRLLLTSSGLPAEYPKVREAFKNLVQKPLTDVRIAFIPTASEVEKDRTFMQIDRRELEETGVPAENIVDLNLDHQVTARELRQYDVVFVDGGNTFYLLEKVRDSGFDVAIAEYLGEDCGVYVGVSAGTVLAGPDIGFVEPWDDKTKATLTDTKGLGLVDVAYSPHYTEAEKTILDEWRAKVAYPIEELRDGEAVVVRGGTKELI